MTIKRFTIEYNSGFTLIETFVAITILMIAILGPMSIISKFYADSTYAKNQIAAAFLAQDGMEAVQNIIKSNTHFRMNNSDSSSCGDDWLSGLSGCKNTNGCSIDSTTGVVNLITGSDSGQLYKDSEGFYVTTTSGNTPSIFSRKIIIDNLGEPAIVTDNFSSIYRSAQITSEVTWLEKGVPRAVTVSSLILQSQCNPPVYP
jgi:type II secretory pathway pseudopilin PulG